MPEFFLELFSEEIPARMQPAAAQELERICRPLLEDMKLSDLTMFYGPRRIALSAAISLEKPGGVMEARGPRDTAPAAALAGFLAKHNAKREDVVSEGGYFVLHREIPSVSAAEFLSKELPPALAKFSWPKSMRWGSGGDFSWVRPLRRMICLLDGKIIPFTFGPVTASDKTEGHRVHAPGVVTVSSLDDWEHRLRTHFVIADQTLRQRMIADRITAKTAEFGLIVVQDDGLLEEITGLVEWPVALIGKIDQQFMDLPPEVRELSMKVNQRYFALRDAGSNPAPYFAFVANLEAPDGGAAIIAGNERVLRARLSDARHFWELDLKTPLNALLPKLGKITFHAKIGTQAARAVRIAKRAAEIAHLLGCVDTKQAEWAGRLCKADLVTGMVGEFPELQGIMGGYYAEKNPRGWDGDIVGPAIATHYLPKGPSDAVPSGSVAVSVALADKLDTLVEFFRIGEKPSGSGDPYALRRAALGVIRIILENNLRLPLRPLLGGDDALFNFIIERLRIKLRNENQRHDVLDAVFAVSDDDDLVRLMKRVEALRGMLSSEDGRNLLAAYKRAANIVSKEEAKDSMPYHQDFDTSLLVEPAELLLAEQMEAVVLELKGAMLAKSWGLDNSETDLLTQERYPEAMAVLASLRPTVDAFFETVTVNDNNENLRHNRLRLLSQFIDHVDAIADFSKIEH